MSFVHLHTHSHYSLLDGLTRIDDMVAKAKELGMPALALTDHGNLYGAVDFYQAAKKTGVKPILGVEAYVAYRTRFDKEPNVDNRRFHLILLAKNLAGYKNLVKLVTASHLEGFYYKPRLDKELLQKHREGLICLSGCLAGELSRALWNKDEKRAEAVVREHQEIFGAENYFIEIMHHPKLERQLEIKAALIALARKLGVPLVATQDVHYLEPDDNEAHKTLIAIQTDTEVEDTRRFFNSEEDFSLLAPEEMRDNFADIPEALENSLRIADACDLKLPLGQWVFPHFFIPSGAAPETELRQLTAAGLAKYLNANPEQKTEAEQRAERELKVICQKGYAPYFLIVADIISFARRQGIFTNTRGSAAGSLVSYLTGITNVDPLVYKLPFERFLNAERPSPPDIDMDFADKRRDEVLNYVKQKYGEDQAAQIGTFGSMMARGAVRDVARALGHPYSVGDKISRLIPFGSQGFAMTIDRALELSSELNELYLTDPTTKKILDLAKKLEGGARHISVHAAGVVIAPTALTDYAPVQLDPKGGKIITQYDMYAIEDIGLLKFDFLGIRNLSILEDSIRLVKKIRGEEVNIEKIPLDDKKTFALLSRGETVGLFQLSGSGMTRWLKELKPSTIHDINAMVALYRPGPMESIPEYIQRKHNPALVGYLDERMKNILDRSYGVMVYQDDVLLIAVNLGGYSWTEADKLRKAMGKKIPAEMEAQKEKLLAGLIKNGMIKKKAEELWRMIEPFAAYGFNKAHAASYGRVAYQTAYMKANYPSEYMTAVLSAEAGDTEKIAEVITECKRMKIPVLPPDINESYEDFTVVKGTPDKIRFGLFTIKNLGEEIARAVVEERKTRSPAGEAGGPFRSLSDFLERIKHRNLNRKSLEALIQAGTFDSLGEEPGRLLFNLDELIAYHQETIKSAEHQTSLFGLMADQGTLPSLKLREAPAAKPEERLIWEKELLGLYVSGHPLDPFRERFEKSGQTIEKAKSLPDGSPAIAAGIIEEVKQISTRQGGQMVFLKLTDLTGSLEAVVFPRTLNALGSLIQPEKCIAVRGRISHRNGEPSLIIEAAKELTAE